MSVGTVPNMTLDLRGLPNPEPILRLSEACAEWRSGDIVRVLADDECFANEFLRWSVGRELGLLSLRYLTTGETELTLRMPGRARRDPAKVT